VSYAAWLLRQGYQQVMTSGYGHGLKQQRLVLASTHHLLLDEVVTVFPGVYHPWHDRSSHAMLEAMAEEIMPGMRVYIVGLGSGVDARYAARLGAYVRGVDINPSAVWNTRYLFATDAAAAMLIPRLEHVSCAWLFADLAEGEAPFDRIFFNVPSDDTSIQVLSDCAVRDPGRRILRAFLTASRQFLKPTGKSVFVHGEPDAVRHEAAKLRLPVQERRASNDYAIFQVPRDAA
jgi:methylase of polypeptide subunit release factors